MPDHQNAGVVGLGLIGASWAALFIASGRDVVAWDPSPPARSRFPARVATATASLPAGTAASGRLRVVESAEEVAALSTFIQECAPEDIALKRTLFDALERSASPGTVLASSTSSFVWSQMFEGLQRPHRCLTAHPFNPPHLVPLVELYARDAALLDECEAVYRSLGRVCVRLRKEAVGHIANRLSSALWREAVHLVAEGIADVGEVDRALVHGPGLRWAVMGAHMAYHLGGGEGGMRHYLEHLGSSQERRWETLGNPRLTESVREKLCEGIATASGGRSVAELSAARDRALIAVSQARRGLLPVEP